VHLPASQSLLLQRIGAVPVEKLFGMTRSDAKTHQTMSRTLEAMEIDQAERIVHPIRILRKRKLAYGVVRNAFSDVGHSLPWEPLLQEEAFRNSSHFQYRYGDSHAIAMTTIKS
jgi:hypothetical protein